MTAQSCKNSLLVLLASDVRKVGNPLDVSETVLKIRTVQNLQSVLTDFRW
jgi:hypothetical protein